MTTLTVLFILCFPYNFIKKFQVIYLVDVEGCLWRILRCNLPATFCQLYVLTIGTQYSLVPIGARHSSTLFVSVLVMFSSYNFPILSTYWHLLASNRIG